MDLWVSVMDLVISDHSMFMVMYLEAILSDLGDMAKYKGVLVSWGFAECFGAIHQDFRDMTVSKGVSEDLGVKVHLERTWRSGLDNTEVQKGKC